MRIEKLQNGKQQNKPVAFGYNLKLNEKLVSVLSSEKSPIFDFLLKTNKLCNETEDVINLATKNQKQDPSGLFDGETEDLMALFGDIKATLSRAVETVLPNLKFIEKESKNYAKEANGNPLSWQNRAVYMLENLQKEIYQTTEVVAQEAPAESKGPIILTEIIPDENSPKGIASIAGMQKLKETLTEKIIVPLKKSKQARIDEKEYGLKFPRATLLVGPPGCGKRFIPEAVARELKIPIYKLDLVKPSFNSAGVPVDYSENFRTIQAISQQNQTPSVLLLDGLELQRENPIQKCPNKFTYSIYQ